MPRRVAIVVARLRAVLRREAASLRQGSIALVVSVVASTGAGLTLGVISGTLERLPGLLILVPPVLALRGNVGGALASRLSTSIHAGTFRLSWRPETLVGQNVLAAMILSISLSFAFALLAKGAAIAFGLPAVSVATLVVISVVGGTIASVLVVAITLGVATASARGRWDLDNVAAPVVTTAGDLVTLPSLWAASHLVEPDPVRVTLAAACTAAAAAAVVAGIRTHREIQRRILRESAPILVMAGVVSVAAGVTVEQRLETMADFPALLMLIPPFLATAGAIGGIFSSRVATKLHLGLLDPARFQIVAIAEDLILVAAFAIPVFLGIGMIVDVLGAVTGLASPGFVEVVQVALIAGAMALASLVAIGYLATVLAFRLGLDPDNYAIPAVTSSLDLLGAFSIILALVTIGVV